MVSKETKIIIKNHYSKNMENNKQIKKAGIRYELYWKNGLSDSPDYKLVWGYPRTFEGVVRLLRKTCNHSKGSDFKVYKIIDDVREELNIHKI